MALKGGAGGVWGRYFLRAGLRKSQRPVTGHAGAQICIQKRPESLKASFGLEKQKQPGTSPGEARPSHPVQGHTWGGGKSTEATANNFQSLENTLKAQITHKHTHTCRPTTAQLKY